MPPSWSCRPRERRSESLFRGGLGHGDNLIACLYHSLVRRYLDYALPYPQDEHAIGRQVYVLNFLAHRLRISGNAYLHDLQVPFPQSEQVDQRINGQLLLDMLQDEIGTAYGYIDAQSFK